MKWLSNTYDPKRADAKQMTIREIGQSTEEAWADLQERLNGKVIGLPKSSRFFSVAQLEEMGLVGVYDPNADEDAEKPEA